MLKHWTEFLDQDKVSEDVFFHGKTLAITLNKIQELRDEIAVLKKHYIDSNSRLQRYVCESFESPEIGTALRLTERHNEKELKRCSFFLFGNMACSEYFCDGVEAAMKQKYDILQVDEGYEAWSILEFAHGWDGFSEIPAQDYWKFKELRGY